MTTPSFPGRVHAQPVVPTIRAVPPTSGAHVVPVAGPAGPPGAAVSGLDDLSDVDMTDSPVGEPLILRRGSDGVFRATPLPANADWPEADAVRFASGPPTDDAPAGVWHADYETGQLWERT